MARKDKTREKKKARFRRKRIRRVGEPSGLDLVEEGVHLLRRLPLRYWTVYLLGAVPFALGFLYFWAEMASSGLAERVLLPASAGMAALFVWMKFTQSYFAKGLRCTMLGEADQKWTSGAVLRVLLRQAFWQPTGLIVLPIASVVTLPFAWCFAFYQNLTVADPVDSDEDGHVLENWRLARMWHEQGWMVITLISLVLFLAWLSCLSIISIGPFLAKSLFGIETLFSKVGRNLYNSTTYFSCLMVSYLVTDPLTKAVYLLRYHYCESRKTGADLRLRLRRLTSSGRSLLLLVFTLSAGALLPQGELQAQSEAESTKLDAEVLDASIEDVMQRREFVWRFPRDEEMVSGDHWLKTFIEKIEAFQERIELRLEKYFSSEQEDSGSSEFDADFRGLADLISYLLIGAFMLLVLYFAVRAWRVYRDTDAVAMEEADEAGLVPDLESDDVDASLLPRNRWVDLARELIAKGDYRLALRAYFLAQLSAFSSEGLIHVRSAKSNREYAQELSRRGHARQDLLPLYQEQVRLFESVWYGGRLAGPGEISQMEHYLKSQGVLA